MRATRLMEVTAGILLAGGLSLASTPSLASSGYLSTFNTLYPNSTTGQNVSINGAPASWSTSGGRCNVCHSSGGDTPVNAYGNAWALLHNQGLTSTQAFQQLEGANSDGSSVTNLAETNANAQPGWKPGATNTLYDHFSPGTVVATNQSPPSTLIGAADPAATTTTSTTTTTTTTAAPTTTTTTAAPTTTTTTARPTTTTTTAAPTTTTTTAAPTTTTTTAAPTTTTTTARPTTTTTTAAPTTTTTTAAPTTTTTTARPTTTTTAAPTTTTTTAAPTTTTTTARPTTTTTTAAATTTTTTRPTTTTTASTTTTTLASGGQALYNTHCASCHNGAAADGGGRNVFGARICSIKGAINGTSVFPNGVPTMRFLQGVLSDAQILAISNYLNSGTVTGQQRYITTCAGCHGSNARGGRTGESVRGASAHDINEAIGDEREMRFLSCLPSSDINAIGTYLRGTRRSGESHDD